MVTDELRQKMNSASNIVEREFRRNEDQEIVPVPVEVKGLKLLPTVDKGRMEP
jgi:hypothetical protein